MLKMKTKLAILKISIRYKSLVIGDVRVTLAKSETTKFEVNKCSKVIGKEWRAQTPLSEVSVKLMQFAMVNMCSDLPAESMGVINYKYYLSRA